MNKTLTFILVISALMVLVLIAIPGCAGGPATTSATTDTVAATGTRVSVDLTAQDMAFDKSVIIVSAGAQVIINFVNKDVIGHNFAAYMDEAAATPIFVGQIIKSSSITYTFTAPVAPGTYFFRCDPHAKIMKGQLIVQ